MNKVSVNVCLNKKKRNKTYKKTLTQGEKEIDK